MFAQSKKPYNLTGAHEGEREKQLCVVFLKRSQQSKELANGGDDRQSTTMRLDREPWTQCIPLAVSCQLGDLSLDFVKHFNLQKVLSRVANSEAVATLY